MLEARHGMRIDELTEARLRRAVAADAGRSGHDVGDEAERIAADPRRQLDLLDAVTLQETSFFRDPQVFADLATHVLPDAIRAAGNGTLTVWSAGCAFGQEAWSLAMLLTELGAPRFEVLATDLSGAAAARTADGVYLDRELRGLSRDRRDRFMVRDGAGWRVSDALRRHVRVARQNASTDVPPLADGTCALALCRYVLIYLTPAAADQLLGRIAAALEPDGRLVIGAAESLWHLSDRFAPEALPTAVAYRARRAADPLPPRQALQELERATAGRRRGAPTTRHAATGPRRPAVLPRTAAPPPVPSPVLGVPALVAQGEAAAARGDFAAAAAAFRGAAFLDPDDAIALVRLGLVLEAAGDPGAQRAFRSAWAALERRPLDELETALDGFGPASLVRLLVSKLEAMP
jgi:chemotaxis protein methyltransferase CheR